MSEIKKFFWPCIDQKQFCPFLENKSNQYFFNFSFCILFFDVLRRSLSTRFQNKILIFLNWNLCRACDARSPRSRSWNRRFFGIEFLKMFLTDQQKCVCFQKSKKVLNHSTLVDSTLPPPLLKTSSGHDKQFAVSW